MKNSTKWGIGLIISSMVYFSGIIFPMYKNTMVVKDSYDDIIEYNVDVEIKDVTYYGQYDTFVWNIKFRLDNLPCEGKVIEQVPLQIDYTVLDDYYNAMDEHDEFKDIIFSNKYKIKAKIFYKKSNKAIKVYPRFIKTIGAHEYNNILNSHKVEKGAQP